MMNSTIALALALGPLTFDAAWVQLVSSDQAPALTGEIIMERVSYCDYVVVRTQRGFALLEIGAGLVAFASAQRVTGSLAALGPQIVDVDGRVSLSVRVVAWDTDPSRASARFNHYCSPDWLDVAPDEG